MAVNVPAIAPPSSSPVPEISPPNVAASFTAFTVMLISWLSALPSSSVTVTVKLTVPLKFAFGV